MRRSLNSAAPLVAIALIALLCLTASGRSPLVSARQVVPTPAGQLGGPEPLPTGASPGSSQQVTPEPEPDPCSHEPVAEDRLFAAVLAVPEPAPDRWASAETAAEEQIAVASELIEELIACANLNDPMRALALYTAEGMARSLSRQGITPQSLGLLVETIPEPLPVSAQARLVAVEHVLAAGGDALRADFTLLERSGAGELRTQRYQIDIVRDGDTWLIDDLRQR